MRHRALVLLVPALSSFFATSWAYAQDKPLPDDLKQLRPSEIINDIAVVHGQVTCVLDGLFYIQDADDAFPVYREKAASVVAAGDVIELRCERRGKANGLVITAIDIKKLEARPLPEPIDTTIMEVVRGEHRHRRVRLKGSVHDVAADASAALLLVDDGIASVRVRLPIQGERPDDLLDSEIEVTGIALSGSYYDHSDRLWASFPINSADDMKVLKPGNADPFRCPEVSLADVTNDLVAATSQRYRFHATVTYASHSGWFYVIDDSGTAARARKPDNLSAMSAQQRPVFADTILYPGDVLELVGQIGPRDAAHGRLPWFMQCEWRKVGRTAPPKPERVTIGDIFDGGYDGRPVSLAARIENVDAPQVDTTTGFVNHYLQFKGFSALVQMREKTEAPFQKGDAVRMTGVVKTTFNSKTNAVNSVRINVQSFDDMQRVPFAIEVDVLLKWIAGAAACVLAIALWIGSLRRQVRHQTSKLLAANDELLRFKQVAETSTDFIAMATLENRPLYMNPAGRRMLDVPTDADLTTLSFEDICTPAGRDLMQSVGFPHAFMHGHWQAELNMRKLSGGEVPVSFLGLIINSHEGKPLYIASVARDISDRHALEQQLRESNRELQRFKAIADTTNDLVAMAGLDRKPLYINAAGRKLLGIPHDEDVTQIVFDSVYTGESLDLFEREGFAHAFQHGHWSAELTMRRRDGGEVPVLFSGLMLYNPDGSPLCMSCIAHDLTQRLTLEKQLRASLDHERELNQLKSGFVNTISHEFRTPLGIILFSSSMLRRFNEAFSAGERTAQLDAIDEAVERMNDLVEQSLSLGRAEVAAPKKSTFDVKKFSTRIIDEVMSSTSHRSPISLLSAEQLPSGHADETMLRTILANLLGNAVKYSPAGSPISLCVERSGDEKAVFTVRDRGPGLSEEDIPKLFTTFHRGKGVEGIPGSGLGLAIVKRCTEALGGTVAARNALDGGAEFIVELPLFPSPP